MSDKDNIIPFPSLKVSNLSKQRLKAEQLRILLAILVLSMCLKITLEFFITPLEFYSLVRDI